MQYQANSTERLTPSYIMVDDHVVVAKAVRSRGIEKQQLKSAIEREIRRDLKKVPSFELLSQRFHVSPRTLSRRLADFGLSYRDILANVKSRVALNLIRDTELSLREIAAMLGYNDTSNFTKAFKTWTGETPKFYRKKTA